MMSNNRRSDVYAGLTGDVECHYSLLIITLGLLSLLFVMRPAWGEAAHWQRPEFIVDSFLEIALKNEYSNQEGVIRKWATGIRYYFDHQVGGEELHEQLTDMHLQHLAEITGLSIKPVATRAAANLLIIFSTEQRLAAELAKNFQAGTREVDFMLRHSVCLGQFSTTIYGAIQQATVIIPVDRARARAKLVSCVVEELTQVMGLPNDSVAVYPSIFNDLSIELLLTGLDYLLLKILYDPSLLPGMDRSQAAPLVRKIVAEYQRRKLVHKAEKSVKTGELYELLY